MKLEEAKEILNWSQQQMRLGNLPDYSQNVYQAEIVVLQELDHLQKENEELKDKTLKYDKTLEALQRDTVWKKEIKELIENEILDIAGFECIAVEDLQDLLKEE